MHGKGKTENVKNAGIFQYEYEMVSAVKRFLAIKKNLFNTSDLLKIS